MKEFPENDQLRDFDVQACKVGDFVFRTCLPEEGYIVRVLKPSPAPSFIQPSYYRVHEKEEEELPYMEFEASLARYGRTVIRTWKRIY